jgi:transposase
MSVVSFVKSAPVLKRSSPSDSPRSVILTLNAPNRGQEALCRLGLKIGGQVGADVGSELGISGSRDTILRLVRQSHPSAQSEPRVIGLDDWARKRRLRYGTLICDLELGLPIDLLPDRSVETVSAWLLKHPSIDVGRFDGSSEYATAIRKGDLYQVLTKCAKVN